MLFVVTALFLWLIQPFLLALFWAIVLTILFYPLRSWFVEILQGREVAGVILTIFVVFAAVFLPLYGLTVAMVHELTSMYQIAVQQDYSVVETVSVVEDYIPVFEWLETFNISRDDVQTKITSSLGSISSYIAQSLANLGQQTFRFFLQFFIMMYALFFFLKDGARILHVLQHMLPLGDKREKRLYDRFSSTVRATIKGTIIIGIIQGALGGIMFWVAGIPGAIMWAAIMTVLSIIPAVGSGLIWGPAGLILILSGNVVTGVSILVVGVLLISFVDNILRPPLVGKDTEMPDILVLLSTLGGLATFGISGFVIGPVIAAFFLTFWRMFGEDYAKDLSLFG